MAENDVLLVVDLQTSMFDGVAEPPIHDAERIVDRTRTALAWARRTGHPVAFIRHDGPPGDPLERGKLGWPVWPALGQGSDEPTFAKTAGDALSNPALSEWIAKQGAGGVILLGAQTDVCIASTVDGALARGLEVTVLADAHSTVAYGEQGVEEIIKQHNATFAQLGVRLITTSELA